MRGSKKEHGTPIFILSHNLSVWEQSSYFLPFIFRAFFSQYLLISLLKKQFAIHRPCSPRYFFLASIFLFANTLGDTYSSRSQRA